MEGCIFFQNIKGIHNSKKFPFAKNPKNYQTVPKSQNLQKKLEKAKISLPSKNLKSLDKKLFAYKNEKIKTLFENKKNLKKKRIGFSSKNLKFKIKSDKKKSVTKILKHITQNSINDKIDKSFRKIKKDFSRKHKDFKEFLKSANSLENSKLSFKKNYKNSRNSSLVSENKIYGKSPIFEKLEKHIFLKSEKKNNEKNNLNLNLTPNRISGINIENKDFKNIYFNSKKFDFKKNGKLKKKMRKKNENVFNENKLINKNRVNSTKYKKNLNIKKKRNFSFKKDLVKKNEDNKYNPNLLISLVNNLESEIMANLKNQCLEKNTLYKEILKEKLTNLLKILN